MARTRIFETGGRGGGLRWRLPGGVGIRSEFARSYPTVASHTFQRGAESLCDLRDNPTPGGGRSVRDLTLGDPSCRLFVYRQRRRRGAGGWGGQTQMVWDQPQKVFSRETLPARHFTRSQDASQPYTAPSPPHHHHHHPT